MKTRFCFSAMSAIWVFLGLVAVAQDAARVPAYDPGLQSAPKLTPAQAAAVGYLLKNADEEAFVSGYVPPGAAKPAADDEFSEAAAPKADGIADGNRAALDFAHRVLAGEIDLPATVTLRLRRYNVANQTFLTDAVSPALELEVSLGAAGSFPRDWQPAWIHRLRFSGWNRFSGLRLSPAQAKALAELLGPKREVNLALNCRLVAGTLKYAPEYAGDNGFRVDAVIHSYKVAAPSADVTIPPELLAAIQFEPYSPTDAEKAFAARMLNRAMVSDVETLIFRPDGVVLSCPSLNGRQEPGAKTRLVATESEVGEWYIIGSKLLLATERYKDRLFSYEIGSDGSLRLDGSLYTEEKRLRFDGAHISWKAE